MQLFFVCLGLATLVTLGSGLKCYQCVDCEPNFLDTVTGGVECETDISGITVPGFEPRCSKTIGLDGTIARSCNTAAVCEGAQAARKCDGEDVKPCVICCDTDNCNSATSLHVSIFVVGLVAALHKFLF